MPPNVYDAIDAIEQIARFESLVQLPQKADPDWPKWSAAATKLETGKRVIGNGEDAIEALANLLQELHK